LSHFISDYFNRDRESSEIVLNIKIKINFVFFKYFVNY
jgi:hypothetical protein